VNLFDMRTSPIVQNGGEPGTKRGGTIGDVTTLPDVPGA